MVTHEDHTSATSCSHNMHSNQMTMLAVASHDGSVFQHDKNVRRGSSRMMNRQELTETLYSPAMANCLQADPV
jgi:hypothetical protein